MTHPEFISVMGLLRRLKISWTGTTANWAFFVRLPEDMPKVPHSELAIHTHNAGCGILAFTLFHRYISRGGVMQPFLNWAHVLTTQNTILDGLPNEVLPVDLVNELIPFVENGQQGKQKLEERFDICLPSEQNI